MKTIKFVCLVFFCANISSCLTYDREEKNESITQGMVGGIIETKYQSNICYNNNSNRSKYSTGYFIFTPNLHGSNLSDNTYIIEKCLAGTRGRVIRFIKERDASQHIWNYVEFEMDDPRLKQKYRIVRMMGLRGDTGSAPWEKGGDFRIVKKSVSE